MIDVLELDCNERHLRDEPDELINEWIRRSSSLQNIVAEIEALMLEPGFKRFDEKLITQYILSNLIGDLTEDNPNRIALLESFAYMT